jgi:hypothetical protein
MSKKTAAKIKKKKSPTSNTSMTNFQQWCIVNNVTQVSMREETMLSIGCIHNTWHIGKASDSTIRLLFLVYGKKYGITEQEIKNKIYTFVK